MEIIITDLTRFKNQEKVCTAGVAADGTVIRPMPYLSSARCQELDVHPGGILRGDFTIKHSAAPHIEDAAFKNLRFKKGSSEEFRKALELTRYPSMSEGFGAEVSDGEKCISVEKAPSRSLITIKVDPKTFSIVRDNYDAKKLKAHLSDPTGTKLSYVGVTDRGFYDFAQKTVDNPGKVAEINRFINSQEDLYLRLGLSRVQ